MKPEYEIQISRFTKRVGRIICVICGLVLFLQIGCQEQAKMTDSFVPEIKFEKMIYDFGEIGPMQSKQVSSNSQTSGKAY